VTEQQSRDPVDALFEMSHAALTKAIRRLEAAVEVQHRKVERRKPGGLDYDDIVAVNEEANLRLRLTTLRANAENSSTLSTSSFEQLFAWGEVRKRAGLDTAVEPQR
jgi:hypothetical protein